MGLLSGPVAFETYRLDGPQPRQFGPKHVETLRQFAIGQFESASTDQAIVGFLAGEHLFDVDFTLEKNVIADALQCALRIDTNQIPAAVRKAWMQMELAAVAADAPNGRPTKAQRQEAREAVEARCEDEARSGKFRRMQQFPLLWDARESLIYFGGSTTASAHCTDLCGRAFDLQLLPRTAGRRAQEWAESAKRESALARLTPSAFRSGEPAQVDWSADADNYDFLGNEFLLWLWWRWETESDTFALPDESEITGMIARTLTLQCPQGVSGKETISAEAPATLPEAAQAIRSGKLPRRAGLVLVRHGTQYELVLQAERFAVSGAKIHTDEEGAEGRGILEDRVESLRELNQTLDLLFQDFCQRRVAKSWSADLEKMRHWLAAPDGKRKRTA